MGEVQRVGTGPGAFVLHRQLTDLGLTNYVVHPVNLDRRHTGVATDKTDSHQLVLDLDRFLHGNDKALCVVYVPTPEQEQRRALARQREQLRKERHRLGSIGRSLLLTQGWREKTTWWRQQRWESFKKARQVGGYTGLCGGVSSSGPHHLDLSITKTGNSRFRRLLIELAWRMVIYQPDYGPVKKARAILLGARTHARRKKQLIVALARQLAVDLWRWQTGQVTPEQLGWVMAQT